MTVSGLSVWTRVSRRIVSPCLLVHHTREHLVPASRSCWNRHWIVSRNHRRLDTSLPPAWLRISLSLWFPRRRRRRPGELMAAWHYQGRGRGIQLGLVVSKSSSLHAPAAGGCQAGGGRKCCFSGGIATGSEHPQIVAATCDRQEHLPWYQAAGPSKDGMTNHVMAASNHDDRQASRSSGGPQYPCLQQDHGYPRQHRASPQGAWLSTARCSLPFQQEGELFPQ